MKFLKAIGINFLSILYIPIMLFSVAAGVLSKAFEKAKILFGAFLLIVGIYLLRYFGGEAILIAILLFFLFVFLFVLAVTIGTAVIMLAASVISGFFGIIEAIMKGFADSIMGKCEDMLSTKEIPNAACPFHLLAKLLEKGLNAVAAIAAPLSILGAMGVVVGTPIFMHFKLKHSLGIGLFKYLGLFPTVDVVFGVIYALCAIFAVALVLLSLGVDIGGDPEETTGVNT